MTSPAAQPTSASSWSSPRKEGMVIELPSGNFARIRRSMDLVILLKTGQIPNPLAKVVNEMIRKQSAEFPTKDMDETMLNQMLDLVDKTAANCFVEPKVVIPPDDVDRSTFEPGEGAISVDDVALSDRFFVFGFVQGGPADLAPFREEPKPDVADASDGEGVRPKTKRPARAR